MKQREPGCRYSQMQAINVNSSAYMLLLLLFIGVQSFYSIQTQKTAGYDNCNGTIYGQ